MLNKLAILVYATQLLTAQSAEPITAADRERAISYLQQTRQQYVDLLSSVNEAQWKYKASPERWSIAECAEHIALTEDEIHNGMRKNLDRPRPDSEALAKARAKDDRIIPEILDRSKKREAPPQIRPTGRWVSKDETLKNFLASRDRVIEYMRTTQDDLYGHLGGHATLGPITTYQWYIALSAHTQRHLEQAAEVTREPGYPR